MGFSFVLKVVFMGILFFGSLPGLIYDIKNLVTTPLIVGPITGIIFLIALNAIVFYYFFVHSKTRATEKD